MYRTLGSVFAKRCVTTGFWEICCSGLGNRCRTPIPVAVCQRSSAVELEVVELEVHFDQHNVWHTDSFAERVVWMMLLPLCHSR